MRLDGGARYLSCGPSPPNRRNFFFCSCGRAKANLSLANSMGSDYQLARCGWPQRGRPPYFLVNHWLTALLGQSKREKKIFKLKTKFARFTYSAVKITKSLGQRNKETTCVGRWESLPIFSSPSGELQRINSDLEYDVLFNDIPCFTFFFSWWVLL